MSGNVAAVPADYANWLAGIKTRVAAARQRAALAANAELIGLYWQIGRDILQRQSAQGWGSKVIERLAHDLREAFPEMKGFSARNLMYMRDFAEAWPDALIVQQLAAQLPWFHIVTLLTKLPAAEARAWYAEQAITGGWSRATLEVQIRNRLYERQGKAITNFSARLPAPHSELAHETLKDPYLKAPDDKPTIGLLLCKTQSRLIAEYALSGIEKPIGVAEYQLVRALPETLASSLPTVEELESELDALGSGPSEVATAKQDLQVGGKEQGDEV